MVRVWLFVILSAKIVVSVLWHVYSSSEIGCVNRVGRNQVFWRQLLLSYCCFFGWGVYCVSFDSKCFDMIGTLRRGWDISSRLRLTVYYTFLQKCNKLYSNSLRFQKRILKLSFFTFMLRKFYVFPILCLLTVYVLWQLL